MAEVLGRCPWHRTPKRYFSFVPDESNNSLVLISFPFIWSLALRYSLSSCKGLFDFRISLDPVLPNPCVPLSVRLRDSTSFVSGFLICSRISCAIRSPILTWKSIGELLIRQIMTGPLSSLSMTPAPISIVCLTANTDLSAIRPYVPLGTWIAISVETFPLVCVGIIMSSELYRSYPAASDVLRAGIFPFGERS